MLSDPTEKGSVLLSNADSGENGFVLSQAADESGRLSLMPAEISDYSKTILSDSPTLYYKLNESSGMTVVDFLGNGNFGIYFTSGASSIYSQPSLVVNSDSSVFFPGSDYAGVYSSTLYYNINTFTEEVWFKTTTTSGGELLGFGSESTGYFNSYDRHIYLQNGGQLLFGVYCEGVGTLSSSGMSFYVHGKFIGSNPACNHGDSVGNEYFRIGGNRLDGREFIVHQRMDWPSCSLFDGTHPCKNQRA